ncbi:MAG: hypothetical protein AB7H96_07060 [Vicinamibacterales bacterium]
MAGSALFYPASIELRSLRQYARGLIEPAFVDLIEFSGPQGGTVRRELAIPYLPGMDAVAVSRARLQVRGRAREMEAEFSVHEAGTPGVVIALPRTARLSKIALTFSVPAGLVPPGQLERLVVRSAAKQGSGFAAGPPLFADPGFGAPGPMFAAPLAGMSATRTPTGAVLTLPKPLGDAWLVQLALGDEAVKLAPLAVPITVRYVKVDALPRDLDVTLALASESPRIWAYPDLLLPEAGVQELDFTPLAQKRLTEALAASTPESTVTLPVTLDFASSAGGDLAVNTRTLDARYTADAVAPEARTLELGGALTPFILSAPAALRPGSADVALTITALGRELNAGSPEPQPTEPSRGARVRRGTILAARSRFVARDAASPAASPLVSVRAFVATLSAAEAVLDLRADAAGVPGAPLDGPIVRQVPAGFSGWLAFDLAKPWTSPAADTSLWVTMRTNSQDIYWFASDDEASDAPLVSLDEGGSWGTADAPLGGSRELLVQCFNAVPDPQPEPSIRLQRASTVLSVDLLRSGRRTPVRKGPREFEWAGGELPSALSTLLSQQAGSGKVDSHLLLFSRAALRVQITKFALEYDPFQASVVS